MDSANVIRKEEKIIPKQKTTKKEWLILVIILVVFVVVWLLIWFLLVNKLYSGSGTTTPPTKNCPITPYPTNITISQPSVAPSFLVQWDPILTTATPGELILGYEVHVSTSPTFTTDSLSFTPARFIEITKVGTAAVTPATTYYVKVATKDTCGISELSPVESFTTSA